MAQSLHESDGGYSVRTTTGKDARPGYMVSVSGHEKRFGSEDEVTGDDVRAHVEAHAETLAKPAHYAGGWHDPETHDRDLDVSRRYISHDRARSAMVANNEDALYDSHEGHSERNWLGRGAPKGGQLRGRLPQGVSPMGPRGYQRLQKLARRRAR